jgi:hypothetical protein
MIEERDANPTADTPGRFRGRRAPTALTAGGTESSEVVARLSGTESSNPLPSSRESGPNRSLVGLETPVERRQRCGCYSEVNFWPSPRCSRVTTSLSIVLGYSAQS